MTKSVKVVDAQGQTATLTGKWLEDQVAKSLQRYGIKAVQYRDLVGSNLDTLISSAGINGLLIQNAPYVNMFGKNARGEFLLYTKDTGFTRIECRGQAVRGSVEDKLPKLLEDCKCMTEGNVIVVLEGDGMTPQAKHWFKTAAKNVKHKSIKVLSLSGFKGWTDFTFRGLTPVKKKITLFGNTIKSQRNPNRTNQTKAE